MKLARWIYTVAGVYGVIALAPGFFVEALSGPTIVGPEFYYGFVGVTLAFQVVFVVVARDPLRYRGMMIPSILEKASFAIAMPLLYLQHRIAAMTLGFSLVDLLLGVLFVVAYVRTAGADARNTGDPSAKRG